MTSFFLCALAAAMAQNATTPGEVSSPYPTLTNLAVEWKISGDDNLNGVVEVEYRQSGERAWHRALPLRRVPAGESVGTRPIFRWENKHSGSVFDLRPGVEYEIRLKLADPDGGSAERTIRARTRPVPRAARGSRTVRADPRSLDRLAKAARPGDTLLLAAGDYGEFTAPRDGEAGRPIVIRGTGGSAVFSRVSLRNRKHVYLEGVTVDRKPSLDNLKDNTGAVDLLGGEGLVVRRCTIRALYGVVATRPPGAKNCYVADNVISGAMPWETDRMGDVPPCIGEGVQMTGPGNVICHNRITGYRDNISLMEDTGAHEQVCVDIYNNDICRAVDDGVEADFAMGNVRVLRNRLTNSFMGVSSQPGLGGPTYFIRNAMYNVILAPFKPSRRSVGDVFLHNTAIKVGDGFRASGQRPWAHALSRNNLMLGGPGGGYYGRYESGRGLAVGLPGADETDDLDYDGAGSHQMPFRGIIGLVRFESFDEMRRLTSEKHAVQADLDVFAAGVPFPNPPLPERPVPDLRLRPGSNAVDAGAVLANINDGFTGKAPDLGAYELGRELPHYGPRPEGVDEESVFKLQRRRPAGDRPHGAFLGIE
ncbi:MAG: right-handed parallel beta-helix repeat-containing protein [Acidobacteria bacterium]|nr:right-handed parallel beta-helix repeat-containing protein [Acidobacteriota bacterium]